MFSRLQTLLLASLVSSLLSACVCAATSTPNVVKFDIELSHGEMNPVGTGPRPGILTNGSFPGPPLRVHEGDHVEFKVRNYLREDTAVHFHGIGQRETPWADGTPGISQGLIRPGASYLYKWKAEEAGVFFYHAHNRGQIMDGLYGSIVINPRPEKERPFDFISDSEKDLEEMRAVEEKLHPLLLSDWSQFSFAQFYQVEETANIDFTCMDGLVVNGVGSQYCPSREELDDFTNPLLKQILKTTNETGITDKGCVPPLQMFQGDFDVHFERLPLEAYRTCVGGTGEGANYTVDVDSRDGWAALTFVNAGGLYPIKITVDNHPMHVYAVDGHYIFPQTVDQLLVNNGNRISVLIKLDQEPGLYKIRLANDLLGQVLGGFAALSYDGIADPAPNHDAMMDYSGRPTREGVRQFSEAGSHPFPPVRPALSANKTHKLLLRKLGQPYGAYQWSLSGVSGYNMSEEDVTPPLLLQKPGEVPSTDLILKTNKGEWVDMILEVEGPLAQAHPMHKHGNKVFILGASTGHFPWANVAEAAEALPEGTFNFIDPPYSDSFNTIEGVNNNTWLAIRYQANYPGAWLFHCHIQTHFAGGMGIVILDGVDNYPEVPLEYQEWNGYEPPAFS